MSRCLAALRCGSLAQASTMAARRCFEARGKLVSGFLIGGWMDRFQEMQVFLAVAQESGFSAAARRLGLSAASVTRAVAGLEQRIGTPLLVRTTRNVYLSEAGQRFLEDCRRILS